MVAKYTDIDKFNSEKLLYFDRSFLCFDYSHITTEMSKRTDGRKVMGSFNRIQKL